MVYEGEGGGGKAKESKLLLDKKNVCLKPTYGGERRNSYTQLIMTSCPSEKNFRIIWYLLISIC